MPGKKNARWYRRTHLFRSDEYECAACGYLAVKPFAVCPRCDLPMKGAKYDASWVDEMEMFDIVIDD